MNTPTLRAAIYARVSTEDQMKRSDDEQASTDDQVRVCTEWAKREGLKISEVFKDEGISGGGTKNRPGLQQMIGASELRRFDVLLLMDVSRLSRNQGDTYKLAEGLVFNRIRVVGVQDGADTAREGWEMVFGLYGLIGQQYRKMISKKTYAALESRAKAGKPTGGRSYGYTKAGVIDPAQAKVVRRIFEMYADGFSALAIASELNRKSVPSPGSTWNRKTRRKGKWLASAISGDPRKGLGILNNERYIGVSIWNRSQWIKNPKSDKYQYRPRPQSEWIRWKSPGTRIVDDALWNRVRTRQRQQAHALGAAVKAGLAKSDRHSGRAPKWLLSSLLKCADCGASMVMTDASHYSCSTYRNGGVAACANGMRIERKLAEVKLLAGLKSDLLTPQRIELVKREVRRLLVERQRTAGADTHVQRKRLHVVRGEIDNIVRAIKAGILTPSTKAELDSCEAEAARLEAAVATDDVPTQKVLAMIPRVAERYRALVNGLEQRAARADARDNARARADLKQLLSEIPVEAEMVQGRRVPVAVLRGNSRALLHAVGAGMPAIDNYGSGGRI